MLTLVWCRQVALISVLRQRALELENGLERERGGLRHPNHSCQLVSHQVLESIYDARCPVGGQRGLTMRFAGARWGCSRRRLSLILPRNRPRSRRGILTNGKRAMARASVGKKRKETEEHRRAASKSCFEVWLAAFILRVPPKRTFSWHHFSTLI